MVIGFLLAVLTLSTVSYKTQHHAKVKGKYYQALVGGYLIAVGIGLQNMPEGLIVALALIAHKYSIRKSFLIASATGLVEPIGGLLGVGIVSVFMPLLPWGLAFAAGAMLFVISDEIIPESHRKGFAKQATFGLMVGFVVMLFLDVVLG